MEAEPVCHSEGTEIDALTLPFALDHSVDPEAPSGAAGYSYVGVYSDLSADVQSNGLSVRITVADPGVRHDGQGIDCNDPYGNSTYKTHDLVAHRILVGWTATQNNHFYERQAWIELGWIEWAKSPWSTPVLYHASNLPHRNDPPNSPTAKTFISKAHWEYAIQPGDVVTFLIKRHTSHLHEWRALIHWKGTWHSFFVMPDTMGSGFTMERVEVFVETNTGCGGANITPGISRFGNDATASPDKQPLRFKNSAFDWVLWTPGNLPMPASGGWTRVSTQRRCVNSSTVCAQAYFNSSANPDTRWYDFTVKSPPAPQ